MNATYALKMVELLTGSRLARLVHKSRCLVPPTAPHILTASSTSSAVWMKTITSLLIFGSLTLKRECIKRSYYHPMHHSQVPEVDIALAYLRARCIFSAEFSSWLKSWMRCWSSISRRVNSKSSVAMAIRVMRCTRWIRTIEAKRRLTHLHWEETPWMHPRRRLSMVINRQLR